MLRVMTPLLGTKNPSAPVGDAPEGDNKAAQAVAFQVFTNHETRDTALAWRAAQAGANIRGFHETRDTRHESRLLSPPGRCFPARCGAIWGGYGAAWAAWGAPSRCPRTVRTGNRAFRFSRNTRHETRITAFMAWRWSGCGACGAAMAMERHGRQWSGMGGSGAAWAAYCPRASVPDPVSLSRSALRLACMSHHVAR